MADIGLGKKLLFSAILLFAALGVCEAALRVRAWLKYGSAATSVRDPMLMYDAEADLQVPRPGYAISGNRLNIRINSLGFRGGEFQKHKPAGTIRIVCLGASTTFNAEVSSNDATWPARLQARLREAYPGKRIEVINAAVGGYTSAENLRNLKYRVLPLDPDLVIYYEANNEIVKDTRELAMREGIGQQSGPPAWLSPLTKASLMADLAYKNLAILSRSRGGGRTIDRIPADLPSHFIATLDEMHAELAKRNIPMVLSTFIVKYRRSQDRATQIKNADVAFYYMPWMSIDGMLDAMDRYNAAILEYGRTNDVPVVDDRDVIPADPEHFSDCMHLVDKGAEVMADRFARHLRSNALLTSIVRDVQRKDISVAMRGGAQHG
jgi:lysophospholipase L1-like esterase